MACSSELSTTSNGEILHHTEYDNMCRAVVHLVESIDNPSGERVVDLGLNEGPLSGVDLIGMAREIQKADSFVAATASSKLETILEQMRFLQRQAQKILENAARDAELHHAACNVVKRIGQVYYLYRRSSGQRYFSILSPEEWGSSCPHEFVGAYLLQADMTFTPATESGADKRSAQEKDDSVMIRRLVKSATQHGASSHRIECPIEAVLVRPRSLTPPLAEAASSENK